MKKVLLYWSLGLAVLMAGAWLSCADGRCAATGFDRAGLALAQSLRAPWLDELMRAMTWLGSLWLLLPLALTLAWRRHRRGRSRDAAFLLGALAGASLLAHLAKLWVVRPRPDLFPMLVASPSDWSYPSAHTMQAMALVIALVLLARGGMARRWLAAILFVALVGWSRIHLQVHFPGDVLFGGIVAAFWVLGLHALIFRRHSRSKPDDAKEVLP